VVVFDSPGQPPRVRRLRSFLLSCHPVAAAHCRIRAMSDRDATFQASVDQFQGFIVRAMSGSRIGLAGYILPSRSNITIINNTNPMPPLG
jgi:hypothetical protein